MDLVVVRGGGDLASGIVHRLKRVGFQVIVLDVEKPKAIRRKVSFCESIYSGEVEIEGVEGVFVEDFPAADRVLKEGKVAVLIDEKASSIAHFKPKIVVDSIIAKKNLGTHIDMAEIVIGVGPGFEAGKDVDLVIETKRGHYLGTIIEEGSALANTHRPGNIMGYTEERVLRSEGEGRVKNLYKIGDQVKKGDKIALVGGSSTVAEIDGVIRGLIKDGLYVKKGLKIGDIDPRNIVEHTYTISDKARSISGGVLEAIMFLKLERGI